MINSTEVASIKIEANIIIKSPINDDLTEDTKVKLEPNTAKKSEKWEPANWRQMLENIRFMRQGRNAPVDTMGCHKCGDDATDEKVNIVLNPQLSQIFSQFQ